MTPDAINYLRQKAQAAGYNADDLLKVMQYESSGDASRWGGKGGQYFGLIQFGPNERAQFGHSSVMCAAIAKQHLSGRRC